jgi:hypothetical protein
VENVDGFSVSCSRLKVPIADRGYGLTQDFIGCIPVHHDPLHFKVAVASDDALDGYRTLDFIQPCLIGALRLFAPADDSCGYHARFTVGVDAVSTFAVSNRTIPDGLSLASILKLPGEFQDSHLGIPNVCVHLPRSPFTEAVHVFPQALDLFFVESLDVFLSALD